MLSQKLQNIYKLIQDEVSITKDALNCSFEYIDSLSNGDYVYSENLMRKSNISENQALEILSILAREEYVTKVYRIYCPHCHKFSDEKYYSLNDVAEITECFKCDRNFTEDYKRNPFKYISISFKKKQ